MPFEHGTVIYDDRLKSVVIEYSECGAPMHGTGKMTYNAKLNRWFLEFWCPVDKEYVSMSTVETNAAALRIAESHQHSTG
jgi:hypothetical protein